MRVLFTLTPGNGSLHPLVPLAHAVLGAGHDVRFVCAPSFRPEVEKHGFRSSPVGLDFLFSRPDYFSVLLAEAALDMPDAAQLAGHQRHAWVTNNLFIRAAAARALPDVCAVAGSWRADAIVRKSSEYSGCVAAEALGPPHASVAAAADAALDIRHLTSDALAALRAAAGLPPDPGAEMLYRHLHLSFMPARFFGPGARFPASARFLRHLDAPGPTSPPRPGGTGCPTAPPCWSPSAPSSSAPPGCTRRSRPGSGRRT